MAKVPVRRRGEPRAIAMRRTDPPGSDRDVSSSRARLLDVVPIAWLDQLLVAIADLPLANGERAVVESMVKSIAGILPTFAVGACFVAQPGDDAASASVIKCLPEGMVESRAGNDPTRIFPGLAYEHGVAIPGSNNGSTLHLASDDDDLDPDGSSAARVLERAAAALSRALPNTRAVAAAVAEAKVHALTLEQRMLQADKLATFGQFAAGVVHELNNPLTSIVAYSDYLIRKAVEAADRDLEDVERLRRISESANRMLRFTRELVSYARPSGGASAPVVLHSVIDRALAFCEHVLLAAGMRVERKYDPDVLTVRAASEQLVQVFVNLITNACQAAPPSDGCLSVTTSLSTFDFDLARRSVHIVIEDNGVGIAPEHLASVFAPFFTTKGQEDGTGLGLSIVKSIITAHGGDIRVESEAGRGTRFFIDLPEKR